ncbi:MAG TPA: hypothetical protein VGP31_00655 [Planosporangium sp.]|jgi:hypothetical protein|nr:hypothetical protein [Planosporangium sp.]
MGSSVSDASDARTGGQPVPDGHLPVSEFLSDRAAASSPFGDDQTFPLPVSSLVYLHPTENPWAAGH